MKFKRLTILRDPEPDCTSTAGHIRSKKTHVKASLARDKLAVDDPDDLTDCAIVVSGKFDTDADRLRREFVYSGEIVRTTVTDRNHSFDRLKLHCRPATLDA